MNRREFLTRQGALLGAGGIAAVFPSLSARAAGSLNVTLKFLGWQGYDDPKAMGTLTSQGLTIDAQYITGNAEIVTKLRSGGVGSIDVVTPGISAVAPLMRTKLVEPIDATKLPSSERFFSQFRNTSWQQSDGKTYAVPVSWSDYPVSYRADLFKDLPQKWADLGDEKYRGKLITLDDPANLWIFARALFKTSDFSKMTKDQVSQVAEAFLPVKANLTTIAPSFGDIADVLARGDAQASVLGWRFIEAKLKSKGIDAASYVPPEDGTFLWCDSYCIPKKAPHLEQTYAFLNQMLSAEGNAIIGAAIGCGVVNADAVALLPDDQRKLYPYENLPAFLEKNTFYIPPALKVEGEIATMRDWTEAWERIKLS
ncbi:extracellular solute-binding protein [Sinorhizobium sp. 7-81]|uniref:ABC transporter substrate-binding protein n=1 Tax=Sinorhizobium sp. 8-89 TaxID=3049089 RepID=UPI0024C4302E|nr:extracellular solute-binding protein [Sinorhizobium sp. 8-89]MDK1494237.1 extracellular solute-binding protein [Sinorhizobium sp. 8-89]